MMLLTMIATLTVHIVQANFLTQSSASLASTHEHRQLQATNATYPAIAGYLPRTDVVQHNRIDLDQRAMEAALNAFDWTSALSVYASGRHSQGSSGLRTLRSFSTRAQALMYSSCPGCPYRHYSMFYTYYGDFDYADKWVSAALAGTNMNFASGRFGPNDFSTLGNLARLEAVQKGTAYMNVWMYVIREFEDAIDDCHSCTGANCNEHSSTLNAGAVHAWDEGVAFYTGSLEGESVGGNRTGELVYRLAEMRCVNFGTCGPDGDSTVGTSKVNIELLALFEQGARKIERGECSAVRPIVNRIVSLMAVPLVQGALRYAYLVGMVPSSRTPKAAAEGSAFTAAVLPMVHHCSPGAAATISANMRNGLFDAGVYPNFLAVKAAFESTYACLGFTCDQVGALQNSSGSLLHADTAACITVTSSPPPPPPPNLWLKLSSDPTSIVIAVVVPIVLFFLALALILMIRHRLERRKPQRASIEFTVYGGGVANNDEKAKGAGIPQMKLGPSKLDHIYGAV